MGLTVGILAASTGAVLVRFAQKEAPSLVIAAYRLTIASLILLPIVLLHERKQLEKFNRKRLILAATAGFLLAIHFATWITSLEFTSVASSVVLVSTSPLFVAIFSPILLGESIQKRLRHGLLLSLIGIVIVGLGDACQNKAGLVCPPLETFLSAGAIKGDLLALLGAISGAGYMMIGRRIRAKVSLIPYISVTYGFAALVLIGIVLIKRMEVFDYPRDTFLVFLLLAIVPQLIGHSSINWALRFLPAAYVSVTLLGEPVASTVWAYLFFREKPSWLIFIGACFILVGIGIASLSQPTRNPEPDAEGSLS
jgi:drug/metabolite transporter (DMT)-like permease